MQDMARSNVIPYRLEGGKVAGRVERYIMDIHLKMETCEGFTS